MTKKPNNSVAIYNSLPPPAKKYINIKKKNRIWERIKKKFFGMRRRV